MRFTSERQVSFQVGDLFYRPTSRLIRDLGVLSLAVLSAHPPLAVDPEPHPRLRVLDAMSGTGVRALRYAAEAELTSASVFVHANDLQIGYPGEHPLRANLAAVCEGGGGCVTAVNALELYMRARLEDSRFDLVDCDAFGTGQPHTGDAWWAVRRGGLLYLCASDSLTTAGLNPGKAAVGFGAVAARRTPSCNEQGIRLLIGAAFREAAARGLSASPKFGFFHRPSSTIRVMLQLDSARAPPPSVVESRLQHVARCSECGELWRVPSAELGDASSFRRCGHIDAAFTLAGPMWTAPMHDGAFVQQMRAEAESRGWADASDLLRTMRAEASAETRGALLFYHLGELQKVLAERGLHQPPLDVLIGMLHAGGHGASRSHMASKALKTSATIEEVVALITGKPVPECAATASARLPGDPEELELELD